MVPPPGRAGKGSVPFRARGGWRRIAAIVAAKRLQLSALPHSPNRQAIPLGLGML